jgi:hypothetical protein
MQLHFQEQTKKKLEKKAGGVLLVVHNIPLHAFFILIF